MTELSPLISCICVTNNKPQMLGRVIECFNGQSYQNKELVILYEDTDIKTGDFIATCSFLSDVKVIRIPGFPKKSLGELRNLAIEAAEGDFVCQWDDDDWYHMNRLTYQYDIIASSGVSGSIMTRWIVFNDIEKKAFVSNHRRWEGSILCKKDVFTQRLYDKKEKGEDTDIIDYLHENNHLAYIDDNPGLYVYIYHGNNTWDLNHFSRIFEASTILINDSSVIGEILLGNYIQSRCALLMDEVLLKLEL